MGTITLNLPEKTLSQAQQAAAVLKRPIEDVLSEMLTAMLTEVDDAPETLQAELAGMTWLNNESLWTIARSEMTSKQQSKMEQLVKLQGLRSLTPTEQQKLDSLRHEYGRITLRKARAYALLSLRGGTPLLNELSSS
jgi:hypothetical protein